MLATFVAYTCQKTLETYFLVNNTDVSQLKQKLSVENPLNSNYSKKQILGSNNTPITVAFSSQIA